MLRAFPPEAWRSEKKKKNSFDWIDALGSKRRGPGWVTAGLIIMRRSMCQTRQRHRGLNSKIEDTVRPPPTTTTTSPLPYLLPLSKHPRQSSSWREPVRRNDCRGVFCSSPRHQKGPLGPWRQGYSEGGCCFGSRPRSRVFRGAGDLNSIPLQSTARQVINQVCLFCCFSFSVPEHYDSRMCLGCIRRLQCVVFVFFFI